MIFRVSPSEIVTWMSHLTSHHVKQRTTELKTKCNCCLLGQVLFFFLLSSFLLDDTFLLSSETASTSSSSGGDGKYQLQKTKLNSFLEECHIEPLGRRWMDWHQVSERTQERYIKRSSEIVKSVLTVVYPNNYAHLWK